MTEIDSDAARNSSRRMLDDLARICDCGGRLSGTEGERAACELLEKLGSEATGVACRSQTVPYIGWHATKAILTGPSGQPLVCHPLVRTVSTPREGLEAEVIDLGRGTPDEFTAHADEIPGRIVLVRHEMMFAAGTIHRRFKYQGAVAAGAVGFLICGPVSGSAVAGSSGRGNEQGIPAMGISPEAAASLARTSKGRPKARMLIEATEAPATARNLIFDLPGQTDEWVVLSAHIDGHNLAQSAMDNASGLVVVLAVARALAASVKNQKRGLRLALFNVEEWALTGSAYHVGELTARQRDSIALNVNLDSVGIDAKLTALTSGFRGIETLLLSQSEQTGVPLGLFRPLQWNSDHANFALAGIPAFRLVAGFNDVTATTRLVLTAEDTREKVTGNALADAFRLTRQIVAQALGASAQEAINWRQK